MKRLVIFASALLSIGCNQSQQEGKKAPSSVATPAPEYFKVDPTTAATLHGAVHFTGKKPEGRLISMNAEEACEKVHPVPFHEETIVTGRKGALAGTLVYIKKGLEGKTFEPVKEAVVLDQHGCQFVPRIIALRSGQTLAVRNSDPVSHSIHPQPGNNREWNQQQTPGAADLHRHFARPEIMIPVKCNIHSWMRSYIGVLDHPYFTVTSETGTFEWPGVPPGKYTVAAWHEGFEEQTQEVTLGPKTRTGITFAFN